MKSRRIRPSAVSEIWAVAHRFVARGAPFADRVEVDRGPRLARGDLEEDVELRRAGFEELVAGVLVFLALRGLGMNLSRGNGDGGWRRAGGEEDKRKQGRWRIGEGYPDTPLDVARNRHMAISRLIFMAVAMKSHLYDVSAILRLSIQRRSLCNCKEASIMALALVCLKPS